MCIRDRLAAVIYPSLLQLQSGITDTEDEKQKAVCIDRYRKRDEDGYRQFSDMDIEKEEECGICMETNCKIVLPYCNHLLCLKCYREWYFSPSFFFLGLLLIPEYAYIHVLCMFTRLSGQILDISYEPDFQFLKCLIELIVEVFLMFVSICLLIYVTIQIYPLSAPYVYFLKRCSAWTTRN